MSIFPYFILFFGWKYYKGTNIVPLQDIDLQSQNINLDGSVEEVERQKSKFARVMEYIV